jgi:hypothetical protein
MTARPTSYAKVLDDIRVRLRSACPSMASGEFDLLTARMAEIEMKYAQQEAFLAIEAAAQVGLPSTEGAAELR